MTRDAGARLARGRVTAVMAGVSNAESRAQPPINEEQAFLRALAVERKRTERSSRRFALLLVHPAPSPASARCGEILRRLMAGLVDAVRETDHIGWYRDHSVIGVLFTEIDSQAREGTGVEQISMRVKRTIASVLSNDEARELTMSVHVYPEDSFGIGPGGPADYALFPELGAEHARNKGARMLKRLMDIAGSVIALTLASPLCLLIGLAVKLTSKGPVIFRQERLGARGRRFTFLKFRSMFDETDSRIHEAYVKDLIAGAPATRRMAGGQKPLYKLSEDPRVTPIGRFLRRSSLDELPQLLNVLFGDMSLVGPRPPIAYEFTLYEAWHRRRLLSVKPGITGLWQIGGRSLVAFDDMVRLDLEYARNWSLWLDLRILWHTPRAVLSGKGAC